MDILDEKGRLFGIINIVDLLVIVILITTVSVGVIIVTSGSDSSGPDSETRYATLKYTVQQGQDHLVPDSGDSLSPWRSNTDLTVKDVYRSLNESGSIHVALRVGYKSPLTVNDERIYGNHELDLVIGDTVVVGRVSTINGTQDSFATRRVPLVVRAESVPLDGKVSSGTPIVAGNEPIGVVRNVTYETSENGLRQYLVGIELDVRGRADTTVYTGKPLKRNAPITIVVGDTVLYGSVYRLDTSRVRSR